MKKIIYFTLAAALIFGCTKKEEEKETAGNIYGVITDKATGEPVRAAGVQLNPTGTNTVTGDEGQYEFTDLRAGDYTINVTKTGYTDLLNYKISVAGGKTNKGDVQLEKLPPSLRVVNDSKLDISELDFGRALSDVSRSFNIFNDGPESLEWQLTETADWITGVSKSDGALKAGATQAVIITIDREKLAGGENTTTIHVTSNNGSKQLTVKAIGENRTLPVLNTLAATGITATTATLNGEITATGLPSYTERGFVYAATTMPTVENTIAKITAEVNATMEYFAGVTGLSIGQQYHVRAYAVNSVGTAYSSNEHVFQVVTNAPQVSTQQPTEPSIANGTITFNGTIAATGDPAYTERGFVYGVTRNPGVDDDNVTKKPVSGSGTGAFSANVSNVAEGSVYYVRAYATSTSGTVYGTEASFDFNAVMPTLETNAVSSKNIGAGTATFSGNLLTTGDLPYQEKGFVYAVTSNPTIEDERLTVSGSGTGLFTRNVTNLQVGNIYYIRTFVTNSKGTVYGNEVSLDFNAVMPTLSTQAVTDRNIAAGTATFKGTILTIGDPAYNERGFVYGAMHNPVIGEDSQKIVAGSGLGEFYGNITGLQENTLYYIRSYTTSSAGTAYGNEQSLQFDYIMPSVTTQAATGILQTSVTLNGNAVSAGDLEITERGFVYSINENPTIDGTRKIVTGNNLGAFYIATTGLSASTTYYVRAYVQCSKGIVYGQQVSFKTLSNNVHVLEVAGLMVQKTDINGSNYVSWSTANSLCQNSTLDGYTNWRLPTKDELMMLYNERNAIGGFTLSGSYSRYWSSTGYISGSFTYYWYQNFSSGAQNSTTYYDDNDYRCRCVRNN
jgi:hypothetical protein